MRKEVCGLYVFGVSDEASPATLGFNCGSVGREHPKRARLLMETLDKSRLLIKALPHLFAYNIFCQLKHQQYVKFVKLLNYY